MGSGHAVNILTEHPPPQSWPDSVTACALQQFGVRLGSKQRMGLQTVVMVPQKARCHSIGQY